MSPVMQYADEIHDAAYEIRVYRGADGVFPLYEDEGDNYNYESGRFSIVMLRWSELDGELIIAGRAGDFEGMVTSRQLHVVFISESGRKSCSVVYNGEEIHVRPAN
jgi:alpha-D-xyloside xylohydrolase